MICCSRRKETHFFSAWYKEDEIASYHEFFGTCKDRPVYFESSTSYLSDPATPGRIAAYNPDAKIIVILRDPVERAFSHYLHEVSKDRLLPDCPLSEAITTNPNLIDHGLYAKHLERYLEHFAPEQILVLQYNDIKERPQQLFDQTCSFLGIAPFTPSLLREVYHSTQARSNPLYFTVNRCYLRYRKLAWVRFFITRLRRLGVTGNSLDKILRLSAPRKPALTATDRDFLRAQFVEDQAKLTSLLVRLEKSTQ